MTALSRHHLPADPRSGLYSYGYDSLNRLLTTTDQENSVVTLTRDGQDNTTAYKDPRNLTTTYVRNGFGEIIREVSPDRGTTTTVRDARGLPTQITDGRGIATFMTYDNAGRIKTMTYPAATAENVTYTYDNVTAPNKGKGRLTKIASQSNVIDFVYDARGNVVTETRTIATKVHTVAYVYDLADRITQITYPSGRIVNDTRDTTSAPTASPDKHRSTRALKVDAVHFALTKRRQSLRSTAAKTHAVKPKLKPRRDRPALKTRSARPTPECAPARPSFHARSDP